MREAENIKSLENLIDLFEKRILREFDPRKKARLEAEKKKYAQKLSEMKTPTLL